MRLIDADAAKTNLVKALCEIEGNVFEAIDVVENIMDNAPTIDVAESIRCKDCKYMTEHYDTDGNVPYWTCSEWDSGTDYDGYCHYGERREDVEIWR